MTEAICLPYERQQHDRGCGAAALCMVYRSFGLPAGQADVWRRVAAPDPDAAVGVSPGSLTRDLLDHGLAALAVQARYPQEILESCAAHSLRVILHHRLLPLTPGEHFSVLESLDGRGVCLHDPQWGPARRLTWREFMLLWTSDWLTSGRTERLLIAAAARSTPTVCGYCGTVLPNRIDCPCCGWAITLQPAAVLGCPVATCWGRLWDRLYCPWCDCPVIRLRPENRHGPPE